MGAMTAATTPKGERRRSRLIAAAGELLLEGGFDAVRHRAVADRAQLPLASTTYYFGSLEDLMAEAAAFVSRADEQAIVDRGEAVARRRRGGHATAEILADVFVGEDTPYDELAARYEMIALTPRYPRLYDVVAARRATLASTHLVVLDRSGRLARAAHIENLIAIEDGAVLGALGNGSSPVAATRDALGEVVDVLAPRLEDSQ
ncbi:MULTISPECIES: TetR/AcrR family transcriptional regulator [Gordonia]|uniref:TetR/AcrR family transcriptional regulator n=1 Tax=Gordonia TaxID=2053 RepID=UPI0007EA6C38|nr:MULTISPECIES: TetR family transcriptional regulator [Gordonia]OBA43110.1 TetR family transcriptional regulator [Gordonia sp. 852002-51296_SCH5728562-b]